MKKIVAIVAVLMSFFTQAQQEISVDLGDALVMKTLEVTYEYYLAEQSSVGVSALFNFEGRSSDFRYNEDSMITPFFRHYFTTAQNWNYFGEIFLGVNNGEKDNGTKYTDGALGVSVGTKYVSNGGLMVSVLGGIGRNMFSDNSPAIVPRVGLNIGYRF
ncbi:DUF3575 domain-containing protein [Tenacibaculum sp. 190524A05c]|uniref:DUF3575 domain-containing protein n=1 Tax=Tenacibaculum platacis TaxID=3137852 RepID=UPI0031FB1A20